MMLATLPPDSIPADELFRRMLTLPRPFVATEFRFAGLEQPLCVMAVSSAELGTIATLPQETHGAALVAACLVSAACRADAACRVFASPTQARALLQPRELERALEAVTAGLALCSPVVGQSDLARWHERLSEGARHPSNALQARLLGGCLELQGRLTIDRPERYFAVPPHQLIDAHILAYRAARSVFIEENLPKE